MRDATGVDQPAASGDGCDVSHAAALAVPPSGSHEDVM
jgi:hypothetical protein